MKKILYFSLTVLSTAMLALSCAKESNVVEPQIKEPQVDEGIQVTINTGKPEVDILTKTEMYGGAPYWSVGDIIGVSNGENSNTDFNTAIVARATTASFSGTVAAAGDYYAYYPYTSNGVSTISEKQGAKVDLPANQNPTATSFDGAADIMVSKKFTVTGTTPTVDNLVFARLGAIVKIVLIDTEDVMTSQHPSSVSMTAESNLAGRVLINMKNQCLEDPYYNESTTVTANYTSLTKYEINGTNATYLIVVPQTLAEGSTLTIAASTEGYSIEKEITIPEGGITLSAGKITTLNIGLTSSHITASSGLNLPFNDNFSWQNTTKTDGLNLTSTPAIPSAKYSAFEWIYGGGESGAIRMSKSGGTGYLTTVALNLSSAFYVHVNSKYWSDSDATHLLVSVDDGSPKDIALTADYTDYYVNFAAATNKSKVKVTTNTNKRAYFKAFDVISGAHVFPSHTITIDDGITHGTVSTSPSDSAEEGAEVTITATPDDGYVLTSLSVTDGSSNPVAVSENKFTMPTSNVTVTATFAKLYTVTWSDPDNGSITVKNGSTTLSSGNTVPEGATVSITVSADDGYALSTLKYNDGTDHDIKTTKSFTMPSHDVSITATFESSSEKTVSVNIGDYATAHSWVNDTKYSSVVIDSNISASASTNGNTGKYYTSGSNWRFYQAGSGTLTISASNSKKITSVTITCTFSNGGKFTYGGGTSITSGTAIAFDKVDSVVFSVGNTGDATNGQCRITEISVTYE